MKNPLLCKVLQFESENENFHEWKRSEKKRIVELTDLQECQMNRDKILVVDSNLLDEPRTS